MSFIGNILSKDEQPLISYADFWMWFEKNEEHFFKVIKDANDIENGFFDKLSSKLDELKDGYFYLAGMYDAHTVELVLTADGDPKNIVFVEELVHASPKLDRWKFTALKPALDIEDV